MDHARIRQGRPLACPWLSKKFVDTAEWTVYDALYAYCKEMVQAGKPEGDFK
jgi:hypothetical protein